MHAQRAFLCQCLNNLVKKLFCFTTRKIRKYFFFHKTYHCHRLLFQSLPERETHVNYSLFGIDVEKDESFCGRGIVPRRCKAVPALSPITMGQQRADNEQPLSLNPHAGIAQPPRASLQVIARITRGWWFQHIL